MSRTTEYRDTTTLRSPMKIHTIFNLDYVLFPKYLVKVYSGEFLFKNNNVVITYDYLPPKGIPDNVMADLNNLPDGIHGVYADGRFVLYDIYNLVTKYLNYKERSKIMASLAGKFETVVFPYQALVSEEESVHTYLTTMREGAVYLREPRGMYYQGDVSLSMQTWLHYKRAEQYLAIIIERVGKQFLIARHTNGNDNIVHIPYYLTDYHYEVGATIRVEITGDRHKLMEVTDGIVQKE